MSLSRRRKSLFAEVAPSDKDTIARAESIPVVVQPAVKIASDDAVERAIKRVTRDHAELMAALAK